MPLTYSIDPAARLVRLHYGRNATFDEWAAVLLEVFAHPDYQPGFSFLADRRGTEPPTTDYVRRTTRFGKAHQSELGGGRWAMIVDAMAAFGMARMGQILGEEFGLEMEIFTDVEEAERWLREEARE